MLERMVPGPLRRIDELRERHDALLAEKPWSLSSQRKKREQPYAPKRSHEEPRGDAKSPPVFLLHPSLANTSV